MAQWPAFFAPDGMDSADFEPARFVLPSKPTIPQTLRRSRNGNVCQ
jgi:hypothetical protein